MSSKKTYANGIYVPWYGYLMIFLLYATPFIVMTPAALMTGLFNLDDFDGIELTYQQMSAIMFMIEE